MNLTQHPRFQWMAGMLTKNGPRVLAVYKDDDGEPWLSYAYASPGSYGSGPDVKQCRVSEFVREHGELDLDDAATTGCLLASVGTIENLKTAIRGVWSPA